MHSYLYLYFKLILRPVLMLMLILIFVLILILKQQEKLVTCEDPTRALILMIINYAHICT